MRLERFTAVEDWTESHLGSIPDGETDYFEYKSSQIPIERLKKEITVAASAFWNTGGGVFIAGVDDGGQIDGGIDCEVGNQKVRDWADQVLTHVEPTGPYTIQTIEPELEGSRIEQGKVVLVISFGESHSVPHMAPDYRYYVRAGTHSLPAGHFLVEAIRARRGLTEPFLRGLLRLHENKTNIVELVILAANEATALDVELTFDPMPVSLIEKAHQFPLKIPIIDRDNPFAMDILMPFAIDETFGESKIELILHYTDIAGKKHEQRQELDPYRSISPVKIGSEDVEVITKSLKELVKQMKRLNYNAETLNNRAEF